jgi:hypothetical protein
MTADFAKTIREHVCIYSSFDAGVDADVACGGKSPAMNESVCKHEMSGGRFGGCLTFSARDHGWAEDEFTYPAKENFPYRETAFEGTISMWLKGDPDADLSPEYPVDPFHISRHPADGAFYLDLTRPNDWRYGSPRKLRFGLYRDSPPQDMFQGGQLLVVGDLGFNDGDWHHLVGTFGNVNSGEENGTARLYIDGQLRCTMDGYAHKLTWKMDELTIGLGQRYVGSIDELLILDTALSGEDVAQLNALPGSVGELLA